MINKVSRETKNERNDVLFILAGRFEEGVCTKLHFESIEITSKFDESRTVIVPAESVL